MNTKPENPYIGPRTFRKEEGHLFFGRDREARDLLALVVSEQLVLFYAQSGAGKSSLINTRLIPSLEKKNFQVLNVGRVSGDTPQATGAGNIYIFNLMRSLIQREVDPEMLAGLSLSEFLARLDVSEGVYFFGDAPPDPENRATTRRVLIVDQFEEVFCTHSEAWEKREDFFGQLAQAMEADPYLWVVLVMREDYIAALDPYAHLLPGGLRVRYYMQRLARESALQAMKNPAEKLRPYAEGIAERLVADLSNVKVQKPDGTPDRQPGQYVEPVQLQVVCYSLWEQLPSEGTRITAEDLDVVGDVDDALGRYYAGRVKAIAQAKGVDQRLIREWIEKKLIAPGGIRNVVLQDLTRRSGGINDDVIQALQSDLVRAEKRGGGTFYELTHDRLVEPILENNKAWFSQNTSLLQQQAALWIHQGRGDGLLLQGAELAIAEKEAQSTELTEDEQAFLRACRILRTRRLTLWTTTAIALVIMVILSFSAIRQSRLANANAELASQNALIAEQNAELARSNEEAARKAQEEAFNAKIVADAGRYAALAQIKSQEELVPALLFGVEAYRIDDNPETRGALLDVAGSSPHFLQALFGHGDSVISVAFSPDGKLLASGGQDDQIVLWDTAMRQPIGEPLAGPNGHKGDVYSVAFSPDGKMLASGSDDDTIILWDVETHQPIGRLPKKHGDSVYSIAFSPDGKMLASGSWDNTIILWDTATRQPIGQPLAGPNGHKGDVYSVAFSPDGKTLASGSLDKTIILWDVATQTPIEDPLQANGSYVESVTFNPDGTILASAGFDNTITLWDTTTRQQIGPLKGHSNWVSSVTFSPDSKTLASGSADGTIMLWDVATRQPLDRLTGAGSVVRSVAFSPDGKTLASGDLDKAVILWDVSARLSIGQLLTAHKAPVNAVAISPDGRILASASDDGTFALWNASSLEPIGLPHPDLRQFVKSAAFSPDGKLLALGGYSTGIILWDVEKNMPTVSLTVNENEKMYDYVFSLAFSPDGRTLASGNLEDNIILRDVSVPETFVRIGDPPEGHAPSANGLLLKVTSLAFSPDGRILASGSDDQTIILWDVTTGKPLAQLKGHTGPVYSVAFGPDGKTLASASFDRSVILWDVESFQPIGQPLTGHIASVQAVTFSPDGKILASGGADQSIILWDLATRRPIGEPLNVRLGVVNSLAFNPDGKTLFSGSNVLIAWDLDPQSWLHESCQRAGRNFTRAEWAQYFPNEAYRKTCDQWP